VIAAGGAGVVRFFDGIHKCFREVNLDRMITKVEVEKRWESEYDNAVDRIYLSCGADGIYFVEPGKANTESRDFMRNDTRAVPSSLLANYTDRQLVSSWMAQHSFR
jgi:hypothetical protein